MAEPRPAAALATPDTYVEFEGRTAYGDESRIPFHVTSADWQESDRLLAGILTAFGARTGAIPIGGYGTFDGVMLNEFRRPRIEGAFAGEQHARLGRGLGRGQGQRRHREQLRGREGRADHARPVGDARATAASRPASRAATAARR